MLAVDLRLDCDRYLSLKLMLRGRYSFNGIGLGLARGRSPYGNL
jgi:hypothetical protein